MRIDVDRAVIDGIVEPASLLVTDGVIAAVGAPAEVGATPDHETVRLTGTLVPGFVDLQVNGMGGHQYGMGDAGLAETAATLLASGVTAHCPTITTRPIEHYAAAYAALGTAPATGPRNLGVHLEGPFLSPQQPGAHDRAALRAPTPDLLEQVLDGAPEVAIVTLAPELVGAHDLVRRLVAVGVVVSAGHTDATLSQMRAAVDAGVSMVTHLFNAQRGIHHREPGTAGAALMLDQLHVGIILDGFHVDLDLGHHVLATLPERALAVTDAIATAGLPAGEHSFGGFAVDTTSGAPRLADGTLAGSNLTMDAAFRTVAGRHGLAAAVRHTAATPARAVGRADLGRLAPGCAADLVLLDDALAVTGVWVEGVRRR